MKLNLFTFLTLFSFSSGAESISTERQKTLTYLVRQDCGSCHGMTFKGGLGPSLLAKDMVKRSDDSLFYSIKYGRPSLAMPGWEKLLSDEDIRWIVTYLKNEKK